MSRLLGVMGVQVVYPKRRLSQPAAGNRIYPYLLEGLEITGPDQVWCSEITCVPVVRGIQPDASASSAAALNDLLIRVRTKGLATAT